MASLITYFSKAHVPPPPPSISPLAVPASLADPATSSSTSAADPPPTAATTTTTSAVIVVAPSPVVVDVPLLEPPGKPVILQRSDTTITLAWPPVASSTEEPDLNVLKRVDFADNFEYQVRFCRDGATRITSWTEHRFTTTKLFLMVDNLDSNSKYIFQVRSRPVSSTTTAKTVAKWSLPSAVSKTIATLTSDEQLRIENLARVRKFILDGADGLERYPEDPEKPDGVVDKTSRAFEGILAGVSSTGVGGIYAQVVRGLWRVHQTGIMSLIFHEELQKTVMLLLRFLKVVSSEIGLSTRDVAVGSYFALWAFKRERLLFPEAEHEEHAEGMPGVIQSEAPQELIDECMYYFNLAGFVMRKSPAEIQWVLNRFPFKGAGFRLIALRLNAGKYKPAFMLVAHEGLKTAVFAVRGTHDVEDVVTDSLCEVRTTQLRVDDDTPT